MTQTAQNQQSDTQPAFKRNSARIDQVPVENRREFLSLVLATVSTGVASALCQSPVDALGQGANLFAFPVHPFTTIADFQFRTGFAFKLKPIPAHVSYQAWLLGRGRRLSRPVPRLSGLGAL